MPLSSGIDTDDEADAPTARKKIYGFRPKNLAPAPGPRGRRKRSSDDDTTDDEKRAKIAERVAGLLPAKGEFLAQRPERFIFKPDAAEAHNARVKMALISGKEDSGRWFDGSELLCNRLEREPDEPDRPYVALEDVVGEKSRWRAIAVAAMALDPKMIKVCGLSPLIAPRILFGW